jgi:transcription-repair coupling factor (superfamily II helicase)
MTPLPPERFSSMERLSQAGAGLDDALRALRDRARVDLAGLPPGAAALLLARAQARLGEPLVVLVPDLGFAQRLVADLRFFSERGTGEEAGESGEVLLLRAAESSAFAEMVPDRRIAMDRLAVLFRLAQGLAWRFLVLPAPAVVRRLLPRRAVEARTLRLRPVERVQREALLGLLTESGYLRVPLVEDPGSFAVRGNLIDVFPPSASHPVRMELDEETVLWLKRFDPEGQRTLDSAPELWIHPAREILLGPDELGNARRRIGELCDDICLPSRKKDELLEDIGSGRLFFSLERLLPAFYRAGLDSIFDYLPAGIRLAAFDPAEIIGALEVEITRAERDREARMEEKAPAFSLQELYLSPRELADELGGRPLAVFHRLAVSGQESAAPPGGPLSLLERVQSGTLLRLAASDQGDLVSELRGGRAAGRDAEPLQPLLERARFWIREGLRLLFTARTAAQADRLSALLRGAGLPVSARPRAFEPGLLERMPAAGSEVVIGGLKDGFVLPSEALCCVTDEEIFGERRKRRQRARSGRARALLQDLGQLEVGDYVVHQQHGIGRYLGLQRQVLPLSQYERIQGTKPVAIEVLAVEYAAGDKLFVPVTRLDQVARYSSAEGGKPRLDRLGGQTFARSRSRARAAVQKLADDLLALYAARAARERAPVAPADHDFAAFEAAFPYEETPDQARAIDEVLGDLESTRPMDRLVCGDVGFGKTEVALRAAFRAAVSGRQVALLCPTTVLAQQHLLTFRERLQGYPLQVEVLSRFVSGRRRAAVISALKQGTCDIVIGTHRVLSRDVHFKRLGLLIVDEEQRFGVAHKERIKQLRTEVDVLTLSATPIPRTLQMAIGGLRELSLIATPPLDRLAVRTFVTRWDENVIAEAVRRELGRGGQVFFVHNRIEGLDERAARLERIVPEARIAVAHGRMREAHLERVMTDFVNGAHDLLCSTAIVENGLDIPRANTILIDRADIYGMAQLYQLRGRVGRSSERAYCYLIAPAPSQMTDQARARIEALERFSQLGSGFQLASLDMEQRGAGDLLGAEQSGSVAAVGLDLFVRMLQEAVAELRGESALSRVDPELSVDLEHYLPEEYVNDVGIRLSLYKRLALATDEADVHELAEEMEDRFGPAPGPARQLVRVMAVKPALRELRVLGCEAGSGRVVLHFDNQAPLDPVQLGRAVEARESWQLTPETRLIRRFSAAEGRDPVDHIRTLLRELEPFRLADRGSR